MVTSTLEPRRNLEASASNVVAGEASRSSDWEAYISSHADATSYHRWQWREVFERAFRHQSTYLVARDGERIVGVLPLVEFRNPLFGAYAVSLPFVNYGGVLADDEPAAHALAARAIALARERGWTHVELRHLRQRFPTWPSKRHKVAMWLTLPPSGELLWDALDRKVRNQVRKAQKSGCIVEEGGAALLPDFYKVFARNMRDLGTPVYGKVFFDEIVRAFPDDTRVFVVRIGTEPIAASITVGWRQRVEVPWASALRRHNDKSPNTLLYWTMLRWAVERGFTTFDFGRSTPNEGTFHFKRQWGAEPRAFAWEYLGLEGPLPDVSPSNPKYRAAISVWRRLPVSVATALGPTIVRHIP